MVARFQEGGSRNSVPALFAYVCQANLIKQRPQPKLGARYASRCGIGRLIAERVANAILQRTTRDNAAKIDAELY
jgi:hypothetical protein